MADTTAYEEIARDAMQGKRVAVFCDSQTQADRIKQGIKSVAMDLGAKVTCPRRDRRVDIGGMSVRLFLTNGIDGRGYYADVVYLSDCARMQQEYASITGAVVK